MDPTRTGRPKSIWSAMAPPSTSAIAVAMLASMAVESATKATGRGRCRVADSARHSPVTIPRWATLCWSRMSMMVESVTTQSRA